MLKKASLEIEAHLQTTAVTLWRVSTLFVVQGSVGLFFLQAYQSSVDHSLTCSTSAHVHQVQQIILLQQLVGKQAA